MRMLSISVFRAQPRIALTMIRQSKTPIIGDLRRETLVGFVADLADEVVVERELVIGRNDQVGIDIPDLQIALVRISQESAEDNAYVSSKLIRILTIVGVVCSHCPTTSTQATDIRRQTQDVAYTPRCRVGLERLPGSGDHRSISPSAERHRHDGCTRRSLKSDIANLRIPSGTELTCPLVDVVLLFDSNGRSVTYPRHVGGTGDVVRRIAIAVVAVATTEDVVE